jgi:hypothetical protein
MEPAAAATLAEAATVGKSKLTAALPEGVAGEIEDLVDAQLAAIGQTFMRQPGGIQMFSSISEATQLQALALAGQGETPDRAAQRAATDTVLGKYQVAGTYRVPLEYDLNAIDLGRRRAMVNLPIDKFDLPIEPGLTPEQIRETYLANIMASGYWLTAAEGETGLTLYDASQSAVTIGGRPFTLTWEQLLAMPAGPLKKSAFGAEFEALPP